MTDDTPHRDCTNHAPRIAPVEGEPLDFLIGASWYLTDPHEPLAPARGVLLGAVIGLGLWLLMIVLMALVVFGWGWLALHRGGN